MFILPFEVPQKLPEATSKGKSVFTGFFVVNDLRVMEQEVQVVEAD
jgi:hypothetical protein